MAAKRCKTRHPPPLGLRHLEVEFTFDDPKAYTKPWTVTVPFELLPDTDIIENICENEKDVVHIFGKP